MNVSEVSPYILRVQWGQVDCIHRNGHISGYIVCHTNVETTSEIMCVSTSDTSLDISVGSAADYSVTVAAVNNEGEGPFSDNVIIEAGEQGSNYNMYVCMTYQLILYV